MDIDAIARQHHRYMDRKLDWRVAAGDHVHRLQRNIAAVLLLQGVVRKLSEQVVGTEIEIALLSGEHNGPVGELKTSDGEVYDCLQRIARRGFPGRRGEIGSAVGIDDDVRRGTIDAQVGYVPPMMHAGKEAQVHLQARDAQQRRRAVRASSGRLRLRAVQDEIRDDSLKMLPIELKAS